MSHAPERTEKNCLNCGTTVVGRYCHICGQENIVPKETFGHLVIHFFYDITHFDGKFFITLKDLLFRPGFLSSEYIKGKRATYLNPVRMYVFTSAVFFLVFFILFKPKSAFNTNANDPLTPAQRVEVINDLQYDLKKGKDDSSAIMRQLTALRDTAKTLTNIELANMDEHKSTIRLTDVDFTNRASYDSAQKTLPRKDRDNFLKRTLVYRQIALNRQMRENPRNFVNDFGMKLVHKLPYILFVSLPVFAFILRLLYVRRRKTYYYADHAIFTIHHYIFSFILLLVFFLVDALQDATHWEWLDFIEMILFLIWPAYLYIAMKKFYKQGWFKTFIKFLLQNIIGLVALLILFVLFFFFAIFEI